ncbi:hypothetical protein Bind_0786 [Beijerinckia indica subsp. indica ATCC 9039]|uniref:Uncharacterized protein n=2 Tax=Beijerinckia TaxID=532 RepID=B2IH22_BEII9|nr:hypothetical protein Bind_0786 [Beijerinckia indica subsp. indica ATCC 9039]
MTMTSPIFGMVVVAGALVCLGPQQAAAQSAACVNMQTGAGYIAKMRINSPHYVSEWSQDFIVGEHKCQTLAPIPNGAPFIVEVTSTGADIKTCAPPLKRLRKNETPITFLASGITGDVDCRLPD